MIEPYRCEPYRPPVLDLPQLEIDEQYFNTDFKTGFIPKDLYVALLTLANKRILASAKDNSILPGQDRLPSYDYREYMSEPGFGVAPAVARLIENLAENGQHQINLLEIGAQHTKFAGLIVALAPVLGSQTHLTVDAVDLVASPAVSPAALLEKYSRGVRYPDVVDPLIRKAQQNSETANPANTADLRLIGLDAHLLGTQTAENAGLSAHYDLIVSNNSFDAIFDAMLVLAKAWDLLKIGGRVIITASNKMDFLYQLGRMQDQVDSIGQKELIDSMSQTIASSLFSKRLSSSGIKNLNEQMSAYKKFPCIPIPIDAYLDSLADQLMYENTMAKIPKVSLFGSPTYRSGAGMIVIAKIKNTNPFADLRPVAISLYVNGNLQVIRTPPEELLASILKKS
jgi:SAM-dependent methyltransferase